MIPDRWRRGEIAVIGLAKSGRAAATLLAREGARVYASDAGRSELAEKNAAELRSAGVSADVGAHDLERIARASLVVASPGVPPSAPPLGRAREAGVPIVGEIEVALHALAGVKYIAVTGTNGKTTTTALIGHLLRAMGYDAVDAGNIGTPLADVALAATRPSWIALELSSFQLHDTPSVHPTVGVLTNLAPDHLDRYASVEDYYDDKRLLFRNASARSAWILNQDDAASLRMTETIEGWKYFFSTRKPSDAWCLPNAELPAIDARAPNRMSREVSSNLTHLHFPTGDLPREELALLGDHNVANALAAGLAVIEADALHQRAEAWEAMARGFRTFGALKHRLEPAGERGGVLWINDSKATNVSSTLVAIQAMTRPTVLLLGGRHKGEPYTGLSAAIQQHVKAIVAFGEAGPVITSDLEGVAPLEHLAGASFEEVVARARRLAAPGDAVLLSPACSSYDMFTNYEERGATFKRLAASA